MGTPSHANMPGKELLPSKASDNERSMGSIMPWQSLTSKVEGEASLSDDLEKSHSDLDDDDDCKSVVSYTGSIISKGSKKIKGALKSAKKSMLLNLTTGKSGTDDASQSEASSIVDDTSMDQSSSDSVNSDISNSDEEEEKEEDVQEHRHHKRTTSLSNTPLSAAGGNHGNVRGGRRMRRSASQSRLGARPRRTGFLCENEGKLQDTSMALTSSSEHGSRNHPGRGRHRLTRQRSSRPAANTSNSQSERPRSKDNNTEDSLLSHGRAGIHTKQHKREHTGTRSKYLTADRLLNGGKNQDKTGGARSNGSPQKQSRPNCNPNGSCKNERNRSKNITPDNLRGAGGNKPKPRPMARSPPRPRGQLSRAVGLQSSSCHGYLEKQKHKTAPLRNTSERLMDSTISSLPSGTPPPNVSDATSEQSRPMRSTVSSRLNATAHPSGLGKASEKGIAMNSTVSSRLDGTASERTRSQNMTMSSLVGTARPKRGSSNTSEKPLSLNSTVTSRLDGTASERTRSKSMTVKSLLGEAGIQKQSDKAAPALSLRDALLVLGEKQSILVGASPISDRKSDRSRSKDKTIPTLHGDDATESSATIGMVGGDKRDSTTSREVSKDSSASKREACNPSQPEATGSPKAAKDQALTIQDAVEEKATVNTVPSVDPGSTKESADECLSSEEDVKNSPLEASRKNQVEIASSKGSDRRQLSGENDLDCRSEHKRQFERRTKWHSKTSKDTQSGANCLDYRFEHRGQLERRAKRSNKAPQRTKSVDDTMDIRSQLRSQPARRGRRKGKSPKHAQSNERCKAASSDMSPTPSASVAAGEGPQEAKPSCRREVPHRFHSVDQNQRVSLISGIICESHALPKNRALVEQRLANDSTGADDFDSPISGHDESEATDSTAYELTSFLTQSDELEGATDESRSVLALGSESFSRSMSSIPTDELPGREPLFGIQKPRRPSVLGLTTEVESGRRRSVSQRAALRRGSSTSKLAIDKAGPRPRNSARPHSRVSAILAGEN